MKNDTNELTKVEGAKMMMTVGLDLGDKYTHFCLLDAKLAPRSWKRAAFAPPQMLSLAVLVPTNR